MKKNSNCSKNEYLLDAGFESDFSGERINNICDLFTSEEKLQNLITNLHNEDRSIDLKRGEYYPELLRANVSLKRAIASVYNVDMCQVQPNFGTNGSIDTIFTAIKIEETKNTLLNKSRSNGVLFTSPTYFRNYTSARAKNLVLNFAPLTESFEFDTKAFLNAIDEFRPSIVTLVTPNNPTGLPIPDADASVMGVQFDLQYNPEELIFNGAASLLDEFMFEYREKENGIVRGLLFSISGTVINPDQLADIISFDFSTVDGFSGESKVEFADLILAGAHGTKIPVIKGSIVVSTDILIQDETRLDSCYPNPFNSVTTISYDLAIAGQVEITVYDVLGRQVTSLVNDYQPASSYEVIWNASGYSSGFYLMRMQTQGFHSIQKVLLLK